MTEEIKNQNENKDYKFAPTKDGKYKISCSKFIAHDVFVNGLTIEESKERMRRIAIELLKGNDEVVYKYRFESLDSCKLNGQHLVRRINEIKKISDLELDGNEEVSMISEEEKVKLSHELHNESKALVTKKNQGLSFVALGAILFVISMVFIPLSFKKIRNKLQGMDVNSLAFYIFLITLICGIVLIICGIIISVRSDSKRRQVNAKISSINKN